MVEMKQKFEEALKELRKTEKRNFDQTVDLAINLKKFDLKKTQLNLLVTLPHKVKEKRVCAFFEVNNDKVDTITPSEFKKYGTDRKKMKKLVKKYDFFIAQASVMPKVATTFGRYLGPENKMPSPQLGIVTNVTDKEVEELKKKINSSLKIRPKEHSVKVAIGKESMSDEKIVENALAVYNAVFKELPKDHENVKNIKLKFTMSKPQKITI